MPADGGMSPPAPLPGPPAPGPPPEPPSILSDPFWDAPPRGTPPLPSGIEVGGGGCRFKLPPPEFGGGARPPPGLSLPESPPGLRLFGPSGPPPGPPPPSPCCCCCDWFCC